MPRCWLPSALQSTRGSGRRRQPRCGDTVPLSTRSILEADAIDQFRLFRDSNRGLSEVIRLERDAAREGARDSVQRIVAIAAGTMVLAMAVVLGGWRLLRRSVSGPLERLRSIVERQRDGDRDALADTDTGAAEVRGLAADFNGLTRSNQVLQEQQSAVLLAHQLALDVARVVHGAPDLDSALEAVGAMLGEGLAVDRILLYTHDESGAIAQRTQWHRYDLPDLPVLPPSLAGEVKAVGDELRRQATVFVLSDFLDPEVQAQDRAQRFYRATGAKSLLMVPVGIGEQGLGVLSIMTVDTPPTVAPLRDPGGPAVRGLRRAVDRRPAAPRDARGPGRPADRPRPAEDRLHGDHLARAADPADLDQRLPRAPPGRRLRSPDVRAERCPRHRRAQRAPLARPHRGPAGPQQDRGDRPGVLDRGRRRGHAGGRGRRTVAAGRRCRRRFPRRRAGRPHPQHPGRPGPARTQPHQPRLQRREVHPLGSVRRPSRRARSTTRS